MTRAHAYPTEQTERTNPMTDHLADACACVQSAAQAPDAGIAISWLTATCEQIFAHLEAQQASPQPATAPPAAQQPEPGQRDGGETARPNLNAQTGYTPTMEDVEFCFVGEYDPETRSRAFHRWLAAHDREVREQVARELIPVVAHKGPNDTDLSLLDEAAHKLEYGYSFGSNVTAAVVRLIRNAIRIARQEQP